MTTIALHKYLQKIEELIDDHQLDEAIAHCRFILEQHPRHVDTYRTLAKAYLERGNYEEAIDLIQRILSTDPSDLISHVALSVAFKAQSDLERSIYHLQRALDVEPYNSALREELNEVSMLKDAVGPQSMAPSSAALARMYLKSEMYNVAIMELRRALAEEPDRIDLKVLLAETLWWANKRVDAVSLSLEVLDLLPNCIPVNAILAEIWLQTGRMAEAQTYLKRLQAMTQLDKAHCDPETAVGRAFLTRGAIPLPDEVAVEQYGESSLFDVESETAVPVVATVDSDWIDEFSMEDTTEELPEEEDKTSDWLMEAAFSTGKDFGTQPLVMPPDPLEAESEWFVDPGEEDEEALEELLDGVGDSAQLDNWLAELNVDTSTLIPDEPEMLESSEFTGMLSGLLDSELEIEDDKAVSLDMTDLFADMDDSDVGGFAEGTAVSSGLTDLFEDASNIPDEKGFSTTGEKSFDLDQFFTEADDDFAVEDDEEVAGITHDSFADGLTRLFSEMDSPDLDEAESFEDEAEDIDMDEFLAADLGKLAEADEPETEDEHTGYTELFGDLSTPAFPDEPSALDSDWLLSAKKDVAPDLADLTDDEAAPDWLVEAKEASFDPVQLDDQGEGSDIQSQLPGKSIESDWLAGLAGEQSDMDTTDEDDDWLAGLADVESPIEAPELPESDEQTDIPTWMLGEEPSPSALQTPAPIEFAESVGFDTSELEDDTAVPTWLLGGDKISEDTGTLEDSGLLEDDAVLPDTSSLRENPQTLLAGEALPVWLQQDSTGDLDDTPLAEQESTGSVLPHGEEELPGWLSEDLPDQTEQEAEAEDPLATDSMTNLVSEEFPSWLMDDAVDIAPRPIPEPDSELDLYKDDINIPDWLMADLSIGKDRTEVAVTGDKDEQELTPEQKPESAPDSTPETGDDDLNWLEELAAAADDSGELALDEDDSASFASRIAAGEGPAVDELPTQVSMPDELPDADLESSDLGWLGELSEDDDITEVEDQLTLDWSQNDSAMDDVLAGVTGELNADLDWLDSLAEESGSVPELADEFEDFDSGTGFLNDLAGDTGPLELLGDEPVLPDFEDSLAALPDEPDEGLDWLAVLEDGLADSDEEDVEREETAVTPPQVDEPEPAAESEPPEDLDDAMAWLEGLAAGQGAKLEELPSVTAAQETEPTVDESEAEDDDALGWLDSLSAETDLDDMVAESGLQTEYATEEIEDEISESGLEDGDDIEDAMAWLEGLAAKQGARLEELPSMADSPVSEPDAADVKMPEAVDDSLEWLEDLAGESTDSADILQGFDLEDAGLEPVDGTLDWLEEEEPEEEVESVEAAELVEEEFIEDGADNLDDAMVWLEALAVEQDDEADYGLAAPEQAVSEPEEEDTPADFDEAMGWLEDLAAEQDSPLEDWPTIAGVVDEFPESEPEPATALPIGDDEPVDELTAALDWLEQLALEDGAPVADLVVEDTAVSVDSDELTEALDWLEQLAKTEETPQKQTDDVVELADWGDEMPEDPDEALAWLQQVAAEQDAEDSEFEIDLADEQVEVEQGEIELADEQPELAIEIESAPDDVAAVTTSEDEDDILAEMPDDPDAAMAWLEQLAARQGAKLEELPSVSAEDMPDLADEPELAEDLPDLFEAAALETELDLPVLEDSDEDLLDWLGVDEESDELTDDVLDSVESVELEEIGLPEADLTELEVPEDMDDAMAWLEALAAQQGAKLEELPSLSGTGELSPDVLEDVVEETAVPPSSEEVTTETIEETGQIDQPEIEEASVILDEDIVEDDIELLEDIEDALPDWLDADTDSLEQMPGQTQWLTALDEPDIGGWLDEEESTISSSYDRTVRSRFTTQPEPAFETGPLSPLADTTSDTDLFGAGEDEIESISLSLDDDKLEAAREAVQQGTFEEAVQTYQTLVDEGSGMMTLIADLETVADDHPGQPLFRHLLGDAYMRNGQLQKALETYRMALDQI